MRGLTVPRRKPPSWQETAPDRSGLSHESAQITQSVDQLECPERNIQSEIIRWSLRRYLFLMPYSCNSPRTHYKSRTWTIGLPRVERSCAHPDSGS